mmetsp:Transcript_49525/g.91693  ORF Transcript_49525/g.91693 Transcript_49525/m.91693 type:complete len:82 (-) Transcript_49525:533-778(-)
MLPAKAHYGDRGLLSKAPDSAQISEQGKVEVSAHTAYSITRKGQTIHPISPPNIAQSSCFSAFAFAASNFFTSVSSLSTMP